MRRGTAALGALVAIAAACGGGGNSTQPDGGGGGPDATATTDGGALASSVSQFGITWTFDAPHVVGQFANGDFWVVGPVTIQSVSPAPGGDRNGSVLDPAVHVGQGYDGRGDDYDATLQAKFPLAMSGTQSLVSSISHATSDCKLGGGADGYSTYDGDCQGGPVRTQAVLTVVDAAPADGTFRPAYAGTAFKKMYTLSQVSFGLLPKLPKPTSAPADADALRAVERPWIDHMTEWTLQYACATENMYCYGREIGNIVADLALYVLLDTPAQQTLAIRLIQLGIDEYGVVKNGTPWSADGGHMNGRKFPVVFAGTLLGDAAMQSPGSFGGEDGQTYYNASNKALWGVDCNDCYFSAGCQYAGSCSNGRKDCKDPAELVDGCTDYRDCCTSVTWAGQALSILALKAKPAWNHDAWFDYVDRWMAGDVSTADKTGSQFVADMWSTYRNALP